MYNINCSIMGTAALLQHAFGQGQLDKLQESAKKRTGTPDYSMEWMTTMYRTADGFLCQPAAHLEGAMVKAGTMFKIKGQRTKTYKDAVRAFVYVCPDDVIHYRSGEPVPVPDETLLTDPTPFLSVSIMRVVVQRSAVARSRLLIASGWELHFTLQVLEEQIEPRALKEILETAGQSVGIGDFRPRYGRFQVTRFQVA